MNSEYTQMLSGEAIPAHNCAGERGILALLPIPSAEQDALKQQGFVAAEYRKGRGPYFKLRYRFRGHQRVMYLGTDEQLANQVSQELGQMQADRRRDRKLARLTTEARVVLRESKRRLQVELDRHGLTFHGHAIRRSKLHRATTVVQGAPADHCGSEPDVREK